jgi:phage/plasmid-associated DNA primase
MKLNNYILPSISAQLNRGHIDADSLLPSIEKHNGSEGYHSLFDLEPRDTFKEYRGYHAPALGYYVFDFDCSENIDNARRDCLKAIEAMQLEPGSFKAYFSGSKGFHLYIRHEFFPITPSDHTAKDFERLVVSIAKAHDLPTLDDSIYQANRKLRMPNSRHPKTGLYKVELTIDQLSNLSIDAIKALAKAPCGVSLSEYVTPSTKYARGSVSVNAVGSVALSLKDYGLDLSLVPETNTFASFKDKPCIASLETMKHKEGMRHEAALALISEYFHRGEPRDFTEATLKEFCQAQGIIERFERDYLRAISDIYSGKAAYTYGCYSKIKQKFCSGQCKLYTSLNPSKRAEVSDAPTTLPSAPHTPPESPMMDGSGDLLEDWSGGLLSNGKPSKKEDDTPSHFTVVKQFLSENEGKIVKQDKDLFLWKGTHWEEAGTSDLDAIRKTLHLKLQYTQSDKLEKCFKLLMVYLPNVPKHINLFEPNPSVTNFKNGTLWVNRSGNNYSMQFKPHNKEDYLTHCLDLEYNEGVYKSGMFSEYLARLLAGDPEKDDKIRSLRQLAGAMLVPVFPQIFFLLGKAGSGKSTFVKIYYHLIGGSRVCSVIEPKDMKGFLLESVIHKTVNIHTDVDENHPIPDSVVKTITDRIPVLINRKGKKAVQAYVPAVNAFCANTLPPTKVRDQKVYDRRMTVIQLNNPVKDDSTVINFEELIIQEDKENLISFAVEGLKDLIASGGKFFKPASSKATTVQWQEKSSDVIQDFITSVGYGEVQDVVIDETATANRNELFTSFCVWSVAEGYPEGKSPVSRSVFYRELETRGFRLKMIKGERLVEGIGKVSSF